LLLKLSELLLLPEDLELLLLELELELELELGPDSEESEDQVGASVGFVVVSISGSVCLSVLLGLSPCAVC